MRSLRILRRGAAADGQHRGRPRRLPVERRRVDPHAAPTQRARCAAIHLRDAPRQLAPRPGRPRPLAELRRDRPAIGRILPENGFYSRATDARQRAPVHRKLGLPDHRLLRRHEPLRQAPGLHVLRRSATPERHRRDHRLGAGPLPQRRPRPAPVRRHAPSTNTPTHARASTPIGAR